MFLFFTYAIDYLFYLSKFCFLKTLQTYIPAEFFGDFYEKFLIAPVFFKVHN